jgi:DNA topoisomerase I
VLAAHFLGVEASHNGRPETKTSRKRQMNAAVKWVATLLGNTPAVCRSSYIDPRLLDRFRDGKTIELASLGSDGAVTPRQQSLIERRVLKLIA